MAEDITSEAVSSNGSSGGVGIGAALYLHRFLYNSRKQIMRKRVNVS